MLKKYLSVLLCTAVLLTTIPLSLGSIAFAENEDESDVSGDFVLDASGEILVSYTGNEDNVVVPNNLGIKIIGESAFAHDESIKSIVLPDGLEQIDSQAFSSCSYLESVTIPDGLISIGAYAFWKCTALKSASIPDGVVEIGEEAFYNCAAITTIDIPKTVTSIGVPAFSYCTSLTDINVAGENKNYSSVDGVLFNKAKTEIIQYPAGKTDDSYSIPDGVASIGGWAFAACTSLASINIPNGVTSINEGVFENCILLTSINLPGSVTYIENYAFSGCTALISVTIRDSVVSIEDSIFEGCDNVTIRGYTGSFAEEYANKNDISFVALAVGDPTALIAADGKEDLVVVDEDNKKVLINYRELILDAFYVLFTTENLSVKDKDGNAVDAKNGIIGTGATVTVLDADGNAVGEAYTIIIMGDVNGDGFVKTTDARSALRAAVTIEPLTGAFLDAAKIGGNETVKTSDARKILRVAVNIDGEFQ